MGYTVPKDSDIKIGAAEKKLPAMVANQKAAAKADQKTLAQVLQKPEDKPYYQGGKLPSDQDDVALANEKLKQANVQISAQKQALGAQPARKSQLGPL